MRKQDKASVETSTPLSFSSCFSAVSNLPCASLRAASERRGRQGNVSATDSTTESKEGGRRRGRRGRRRRRREKGSGRREGGRE
eukprot:1484356-Rhodomonas_salina.1